LETQLLQTYLLQLSLLHSSFYPTYVAWSRSTRHSLSAKFNDVAARAQVVQQNEKEIRHRDNVTALLEWGGGPDAALGENIQTLAGIVQEVTVMSEENGRVHSCVTSFEEWFEVVQEVRAERGSAAIFVEGLGEEWRAETTALVRRLSGLWRMLETLERPAEPSSVADIVFGTRDLLKGMLDEITTVVDIEKTVMEREKDWVDEQLRQLEEGLEITA
jgi:hypothetical protein